MDGTDKPGCYSNVTVKQRNETSPVLPSEFEVFLKQNADYPYKHDCSVWLLVEVWSSGVSEQK